MLKMINPDICEIIAVRHGQTIANKTGRLQGQFDTPLDEVGQLQADAIAARLKKCFFDIVYSSDLERAMVTAGKIIEFHPGKKVIPSKELREWNLGELQGHEYKELIEKYPRIMDAFKNEGETPPIPGGESVMDFHNRIVTFIDKIAAENIGKRVLIVSHGGAMQRLFLHTTGQLKNGNIRPLCDNASLSVFRFKNHQWQLVTWNDIAHLENIGTHATLTF